MLIQIKKQIFILLLINLIKPIFSVILTPPYFNLVANKRVTATATCGENVRERELYCKLTGSTATDRETSNYANLIQGQYCDYCDPSDPQKTHHANYSIDGTEKWWQSPPLSRSLDYNQVNLTIDLGQEFHVAYIYIKMANSPRPGVWALEKSVDNGETYQPWQYFADTPSDCFNFFSTQANKRIMDDNDVICTTDYSKVLPVEGGEILVSLVNNRPNSKNFTHADVLQKWTRATNVRLRLLRTKNLLGHLMAVAKQDPTVTRRYFYSIRDISIGGRCVCNGHAQHCDASSSANPTKLICRCSHNTCGDQCETCCDGFVQKKWRQNRENDEFECEPCQCYGHASNCTYDSMVDEKKLSIDIYGNYEGGGVCVDCQHNTQGINCQECKPGYYRPFDVPITSPDACRKCECDNPYSTGNCAPLTGECECKPQYSGRRCDSCANGYTDWPKCQKCDCDINGRAGNSCKPPCECKFGYLGPFCDQCVDRYYGFPNCTPCDCDKDGRYDLNCNKETGQCICRPGYTGLRCDKCENGYFGEKICQVCDCDVGTTEEVCHKNNGTCICAPNFTGERCNECAPGFYNFPNCLPCECDEEGSLGSSCTFFGNQPQCTCKEGRSGSKCDQCAPGYYKYPECIECKCDEAGTIGQSCDPISGKCNCKSNFAGDKCSECSPGLFNYPICEPCSCNPDGTDSSFPGCKAELRMSKGIVCPCKDYVTGRKCDICKDRYYGLGSDVEKGCSACECNRDGSLNELDLCEQNDGQCYCKLFVDSTACRECKSGFYSLERNDLFGCQACDCQAGSSVDNNCNSQTGQCNCLKNIVGSKCEQPAAGFFIPDLHQLKYELEDGYTKNDKQVRYSFDEEIFPKFSWKGYVHLNKVVGEVTQEVRINKLGTYRMIIRYLNNNTNSSELFVRVRETQGNDEQNATLYLASNSEPSYETVTVNQISALILELEPATYKFSFESKYDNLFIDYFVLLPSDYFEATVLTKHVVKPCQDYRDEELCIQYKYPSINNFQPAQIYDEAFDSSRIVDLDSFKEFNHTYEKPFIAVKLDSANKIVKNLKFNEQNYVLLVDFMNVNEDGQEVNVEISHSDSNRKQYGRVYLYKCNITTPCREVILSKDFNEPLHIEGKESANIALSLAPGSSNEILVYQITLVPKDKFNINHIKVAPYCIVKDKKCLPLDYQQFSSVKVDLETDDNNGRHDLYHTQQKQYNYIPTDKVLYLYNYFPEVTVPVQVNKREQGEQVLIVHYYQPNHPSVSVTVFLDKKNNGTFKATYCPSISGCRAIVKFESNSETFTNPDFQTVTFQLTENGKDIWLDYVLLASATTVNPDLVFNYAPIDMTSDFISKCASQHFNIEYYSSLFCDQSVLSLSVAYNDGALDCECDKDGSLETKVCDYFGGQCECRENVIGRRCSRCKTGYFGFPNCQKCDCPTGNCDDITGKCVSPPNVNEDGDTCLDGYYGFHPIFGCEECKCNTEGTENGQTICDKETGQCLCRSNTDGLSCDRCKAGYYEYPACYNCDCNVEGTIAQICDDNNAQCLCKENIIGDRCDYCKRGTFNLEARNPKGCTNCFCFGAANVCRNSDLFFGSERNFNEEEWRLAYAKLNSNSSNIVIGIKNDPEGSSDALFLDLPEPVDDTKLSESIYWSAPSSYTGNKVTSYGGTIKYRIRVISPENSQSVIRPDLILVGYNMSLAITSNRQPVNREIFENTIDLLESQFSHLLTGSSATRDQLMMVLSVLTEIKLRATYYNKLHHSELIDFTLDVAQEYQEGRAIVPAFSAEQCYCPENYRGYSCESCEYGYYKVKGNGPGLFNCVPCNCNGHADTCDQETGECIDCRDNTIGKNCESCKKGYHQIDYGNGITGCRLCPCPGPSESNIFAETCNFDVNSNKVYYCNCMPGYTGQYCERCAPGFYGDPTRPGGKCLPCQCNNNIDMRDYDSCDQRTGACLKCLNNTAGINCERCADWHYGDPIVLKNCQKCSCDQCGSESCDEKTGECTCKPNVVGYNCASCGEDMWGFNQCNGCHQCNCDPIGSISSQCDSRTGDCLCKPGVGGKQCNKCLDDHWNFSETGCQKCLCQRAGVQITNTGGFACNSTTGYCTCIEGVSGKLCDTCKPRWVLVNHVGCKKCDTCVNTLLDDVEELFVKADGIESGNRDSSLTFKAHNKLIKLENEFKLIDDAVDPSQYGNTPLLNLQRSIQSIQNDLLGLKLMTEYNINDKIKLLTKLLSDAELFNKDINDLRIKLDVLDQIIDELDKEELNDLKNITDDQLTIYENIVDQISSKDFQSTLDKYKELLDEFETANKTVHDLKNDFEYHSNEIESIKNKNFYIQKSLNELKALIDKAKNLEKFRDKDVEFKAYFDNLEQIRNETNALQASSSATLRAIENLIKQGEETLESSNKDLQDLNSKVEDLQELYSDHDNKYKELQSKCYLAEEKTSQIVQLSKSWKDKVLRSQEGIVAYETAQIYENIADTLIMAHDKSIEILKQYTQANQNLDGLVEKIEERKKESDNLDERVKSELEKKAKSEQDYLVLSGKYSDLERKSKNFSKNLEKIDWWLNRTFTSDLTLTNLKNELDSQQIDLNKNQEKADDLIRKIQSLDSLRSSLPKPDIDGNTENLNGEQLLKSIENSIDNLKTTAPTINSTVKKLLEENNFNSELEKISKDIYDLKILIESTRQIANDIKVAINFNESSVVNLKSPVDLHPSMSTSSSLYLRTTESYAPIALIYNESSPNEYLSLYIQQGRPHFQYKLSNNDASASVVSTDIPINDGEWHKVKIERIGKLAKLKVYSRDNYQEKSKESMDDSVVFNIDPNGAKFILGQFPFSQLPNDLRTIAAYNNQFRGAMDSIKFNGNSLGLWNYVSAKNIKGELNRKFTASDDQQIELGNENGVYFLEDSFMCLNNSKLKFSSKYSIDLTIRFKTESPNGVLWIWYNDERQHISVYLESGHINVAIHNSAENRYYLFEKVPSKTSYRLDDNKFHTIMVTLSRSTLIKSKASNTAYAFNMKVVERFEQEQETFIDERSHSTNRHFSVRNGKQCIGGLLATDRENIFKDAQFNSYMGCMVSLAITNGEFKTIDLQQTLHDPGTKAYNVAPNCPGSSDQCEIKKSSSPVFLQFDVDQHLNNGEDTQETIGISFVTTNPNGVLFFRIQDRGDQTTKYLLELRDSQIVLSVYDSDTSFSIKSDSKKQFNDNKLHSAYIIRRESSIELRVDNQLEAVNSDMAQFDSSVPANVNSLYVAGVPESQRGQLQESFTNFEGCIIEIIYNNHELELAKANSRSQKSMKFSKCYKSQIRSALLNIPGYKELQNTVYINRFSQNMNYLLKNSGSSLKNDECTLNKQYDTSQLKSVGLRFGLSKRSRLEVHDTFPIKISTFVSFKFRTLQPDGLMFYASDAQFNDFISVWLQDGYVNYAFDCGSGFVHIKSKSTYSDGRYHTVTIKRDMQTGVLIISDRTNTTIIENIQDKSIGVSNALSVVEPYYFGNIPDNDASQLPAAQTDLIVTEPFVGCMSDFNIAYKQLRQKLYKIDLMNCSNNHESGLFFTGHSMTSFASLPSSVSLNNPFEISFEIKSRTKNGVVLFIGNKDASNSDYILLELVNGELVYKISVNGLENVAKFMPQQARNELCNSSWIRIKLKKDEKNSITLELKGNEISSNFNRDIKLMSKSSSTKYGLYIGSLPSKASYSDITQTNEPFIGCIRDFVIKKNNNLVPSKVLLEMNLESGVFNYCPLK